MISVIFLAGRIRPESKRFGIVQCDLVGVEDLNTALLRPFNYQGKQYIYAGPYVYGCEESQKNQSNDTKQQKQIDQEKMIEERKIQNAFTFNRTLDGMKKTDHFFVWIEDQACFGTIWELGYLFALGKKVYLAYSKKIQPNGNLWFSFHGGTHQKQCENVEEGLQWFFTLIS